MLKIIKNPDKETYELVRKAVNEHGGFCPCELAQTSDTKCPCKAFREQDFEGECHCGLYCKIEVDE